MIYIYCLILQSFSPRGYLPKGWIRKISTYYHVQHWHLYLRNIISSPHHSIYLRISHIGFHISTVSIPQIHLSLLTVQGRLSDHEAHTPLAAGLSAAARPIGPMSTKVQCQCAGLTSCLPNIDLFSMVREQQVQTSNTIFYGQVNPVWVNHQYMYIPQLLHI